jgi:hypothetical protein
MSPADVAAYMLLFFTAYGYTPTQISALTHQAQIESGLDPCVRGSGGSWLFQWVGERRRELEDYSGTNDCPLLKRQLEFTDYELHKEPFLSFFDAPSGEEFRVLRSCFGRGRC